LGRMMGTRPREGVFTTLLWDEDRGVADLPLHERRLVDHGARLRLNPDLASLRSALHHGMQHATGQRLVRAMWSVDGWTCTDRPLDAAMDDVDAITVAAPRWAGAVTGTKHAAWAWNTEVMDAAESMGADAALLVHDHRIVDERRSCPVLLDEDGVCWAAREADGGVQSITLEAIAPRLERAGFPVQRGDLNERRVARSRAMVLFGTGLGAVGVSSIDGVGFEEPTDVLLAIATTLINEHRASPSTWTRLEGD
jgi:branched-subunit amino acid aminotransferase/4-amino-4-deoxychorismate lyase